MSKFFFTFFQHQIFELLFHLTISRLSLFLFSFILVFNTDETIWCKLRTFTISYFFVLLCLYGSCNLSSESQRRGW
jgi:hypothetical protein